MTTKTTYTVDGTAIKNTANNVFSFITDARFKVINKEGKTVVGAPLYLALILGIFLPFLTVGALIIVLVMSYTVAIEKESESKQLRIGKK